MTTSVDVPTHLFSEIQLRATQQGEPVQAVVVDLLRKGLAASSALPSTPDSVDDVMLQRRKQITENFISGEWGVDLAGCEESREVDRRKAMERAEAWRR